MTDSQYESYVNSGGISGVKIEIGILNESYEVDEELLIEEFSGAADDLSDDMLAAAEAVWGNNMYAALEELDAGDWLTAVDGEVVEASEFHPYRVHVETY